MNYRESGVHANAEGPFPLHGKLYPNVKIQVEGKGSATAPPALAKGLAQLAPMSRAMKAEEEDAVDKAVGVRPTRIAVALDCLAVYVHKDNPVHGLTLAQLDCIFSKTRKSGYADISTWGQAGLEGDWAKLPASLYGRNSASGTYAYFKEHALQMGDYKDTVKEQPGSAAVVSGVTNDRGGSGTRGSAIGRQKSAPSRWPSRTRTNSRRPRSPMR